LLQPQLGQLRRTAHAIEIKMPDLACARGVGLQQVKRRARHLHFYTRKRADKSAGEGRLAASELALQQNAIPRPRERRKLCGELRRRRLARQIQGKLTLVLQSTPAGWLPGFFHCSRWDRR